MSDVQAAAERLAVVADHPAHVLRWGEGDRNDLRTLLSALQEAREALVPDGWALVPIEPTDEMVDAADVPFHAEWRAQRESSVRLYGKEAYASDPFSRATWKAMLSAAEVYRAMSSDPEQPK